MPASNRETALARISHVTLVVTDLDRSLTFYRDALGARPCARWDGGAHLDAGGLWLCLELGGAVSCRGEQSYLAFAATEEAFAGVSARLRGMAPVWKENRSEGASLYILDPDRHRLEIHVGSLASRAAAMRAAPAPEFDPSEGRDSS